MSAEPTKSRNNEVFPVERFEVDTIAGDRLCLTVHYFPDPESFNAQKSIEMRFLMPNDGAVSLSGMLTGAVTETRRKNPFSDRK
jgi:hypothetical protein